MKIKSKHSFQNNTTQVWFGKRFIFFWHGISPVIVLWDVSASVHGKKNLRVSAKQGLLTLSLWRSFVKKKPIFHAVSLRHINFILPKQKSRQAFQIGCVDELFKKFSVPDWLKDVSTFNIQSLRINGFKFNIQIKKFQVQREANVFYVDAPDILWQKNQEKVRHVKLVGDGLIVHHSAALQHLQLDLVDRPILSRQKSQSDFQLLNMHAKFIKRTKSVFASGHLKLKKWYNSKLHLNLSKPYDFNFSVEWKKNNINLIFKQLSSRVIKPLAGEFNQNLAANTYTLQLRNVRHQHIVDFFKRANFLLKKNYNLQLDNVKLPLVKLAWSAENFPGSPQQVLLDFDQLVMHHPFFQSQLLFGSLLYESDRLRLRFEKGGLLSIRPSRFDRMQNVNLLAPVNIQLNKVQNNWRFSLRNHLFAINQSYQAKLNFDAVYAKHLWRDLALTLQAKTLPWGIVSPWLKVTHLSKKTLTWFKRSVFDLRLDNINVNWLQKTPHHNVFRVSSLLKGLTLDYDKDMPKAHIKTGHLKLNQNRLLVDGNGYFTDQLPFTAKLNLLMSKRFPIKILMHLPKVEVAKLKHAAVAIRQPMINRISGLLKGVGKFEMRAAFHSNLKKENHPWHYDTRIHLYDAALTKIPDLWLSHLNGQLLLADGRLHSQGFAATMRGQPVHLLLNSNDIHPLDSLKIQLVTQQNLRKLSRYLCQSKGCVVCGQMPIKATFLIDQMLTKPSMRFFVSSNLKGVSLIFPDWYRKDASSLAKFFVSGQIHGHDLNFRLALANVANVMLTRDTSGYSGVLAIGKKAIKSGLKIVPNTWKINVDLPKLPSIWLAWYQRMLAHKVSSHKPIVLDLHFDVFHWSIFDFEGLNAHVLKDANQLRADFVTPVIQGSLLKLFGLASKKWQLNIDYWRPKRNEIMVRKDVAGQDFDLNWQIKALELKEHFLHNISGSLQTTPAHRLLLRNVEIHDFFGDLQGHAEYFKGQWHAAGRWTSSDIALGLNEWFKWGRFIHAKGYVNFDLLSYANSIYSNSPTFLGTLDFALKQGYLVIENPELSSRVSLAELLTLFNPVGVVKHISTGFGNLANTGFHFDSLNAKLYLKNKMLQVVQAKAVGSAADLSLTGLIALPSKKLGLSLDVLPKLTSSLPTIVGLGINLPLGIAALLMDKTVWQSNNLLHYDLSGSLDNIHVQKLQKPTPVARVKVFNLSNEAPAHESLY